MINCKNTEDKYRHTNIDLSQNRQILCHEEETVKCNGLPVNSEDYTQHLIQIHKYPSIESDGQIFYQSYSTIFYYVFTYVSFY